VHQLEESLTDAGTDPRHQLSKLDSGEAPKLSNVQRMVTADDALYFVAGADGVSLEVGRWLEPSG
jgi:hypothetical protein